MEKYKYKIYTTEEITLINNDSVEKLEQYLKDIKDSGAEFINIEKYGNSLVFRGFKYEEESDESFNKRVQEVKKEYDDFIKKQEKQLNKLKSLEPGSQEYYNYLSEINEDDD